MCLSNKMLPIRFDMESCCSALLHELNYFPCLYSRVARGIMTLITQVVHMRGKKKTSVSLYLPFIFFLYLFPTQSVYDDPEQLQGGAPC